MVPGVEEVIPDKSLRHRRLTSPPENPALSHSFTHACVIYYVLPLPPTPPLWIQHLKPRAGKNRREDISWRGTGKRGAALQLQRDASRFLITWRKQPRDLVAQRQRVWLQIRRLRVQITSRSKVSEHALLTLSCSAGWKVTWSFAIGATFHILYIHGEAALQRSPKQPKNTGGLES